MCGRTVMRVVFASISFLLNRTQSQNILTLFWSQRMPSVVSSRCRKFVKSKPLHQFRHCVTEFPVFDRLSRQQARSGRRSRRSQSRRRTPENLRTARLCWYRLRNKARRCINTCQHSEKEPNGSKRGDAGGGIRKTNRLVCSDDGW
ncbi:hypothetical protein AVEN_62240-1 [Araneus ventricosus]|uniref:Secreted protein n=1 Tax=Araneus ventricosus TaxID=182803 RepID=A0A4Y2E9A6_ARAVE|nr:hypothetical protein AVEN_62240-1 [Araneus ventricosus]